MAVDHAAGYDYLLKYIVVGDVAVGKTALVLQLTDKRFDQAQNYMTLGVEFGTTSLRIRDKTVRIDIWDTAGSDAFRSITRSYYRGAACALLVYDASRKSTFTSLASWVTELERSASKDVVITLVGNKCDLVEKREVSTAEGREFAERHGFAFFETSARTSENVDRAFSATAERLLRGIEEGKIDLVALPAGIKLGNLEDTAPSTEKPKKGKCC